MTSTATKAASQQLKALEDVISSAQTWALEEAKALLTIRDRRLYLPKYENFEQYGQERWNYERAQMYRLIAWAQTVDAVSPIGGAPAKESHARPLYGLEPDVQRSIWRSVVRTGSKITASLVTEAVTAHIRGRTNKNAVRTPTLTSGSVVCADGISAMNMLADDSVDLLLTSPPWADVCKAYPGIPEAKFPQWLCDLLAAARPKLKTSANVLIEARPHVRNGQISDYLLRSRLALRDAGWFEIDEIVWSKPDASPTGRPDRPRRTWSSIYWFSRSTSPFCDLRACSEPGDNPLPSLVKTKGGNQGATFTRREAPRVTDMVTVHVGSNESVDHPTPFPVALCD